MELKTKKKIIKYLEKVDKLLIKEREEGGYHYKQMIAEFRIKLEHLETKIRREA